MQQCGDISTLKVHLTIKFWAWDFYEVIIDEAEDRISYYLLEIKS